MMPLGIEPITFGPWEWALLILYVCGLPVGMPMLVGTWVGTVVRGASTRRGLGVGLLVGIASAPLTVVGEFLIAGEIVDRFTNPTWLLWLMVAVPATLFAILAAYLIWRGAVLSDIRHR